MKFEKNVTRVNLPMNFMFHLDTETWELDISCIENKLSIENIEKTGANRLSLSLNQYPKYIKYIIPNTPSILVLLRIALGIEASWKFNNSVPIIPPHITAVVCARTPVNLGNAFT